MSAGDRRPDDACEAVPHLVCALGGPACVSAELGCQCRSEGRLRVQQFDVALEERLSAEEIAAGVARRVVVDDDESFDDAVEAFCQEQGVVRPQPDADEGAISSFASHFMEWLWERTEAAASNSRLETRRYGVVVHSGVTAEDLAAVVRPVVEACYAEFDVPDVPDEQLEPELGITYGVLRRARAALEAWPAEAARDRELLEYEREIWSVQSRVIRALAAEVPDDVRARVLAPLRDLDPTGSEESA